MGFEFKKTSFQNILVNALGSLIAGIAGSIIILVIAFFLSDSLAISTTFEEARIGLKTSPIFPLILSIITLIGTTITMFLTYYILNLTDDERYKKNVVILGQITFFTFITYLFITPMYIYVGVQDYDNIMVVYLFHVMILAFGTHLILETLNNYRHILIGIYGSFVGLFLSTIITVMIFSSFTGGFAKLISLLVLLPIINFSITFFKQLFELTYYYYNKYSNQDPLGDIFYQIEMEEKELLRLEEEKNSI